MASKQRPLTVLVDMDGVLADFDGQFLQNFRERYPNDRFVPLEDRKTFYIDDQYDDPIKVNKILAQDGFYGSLQPIEGAIDALKEMSSMKHVKVFICSSPYITNYEACSREKGAWIAHYLGRDWLRRFILTSDKTLVRGDILIDDKHRITGSMTPVWEQVLFTACHNRHIDLHGRIRMNTWNKEEWVEIIEYYKKKCFS